MSITTIVTQNSIYTNSFENFGFFMDLFFYNCFIANLTQDNPDSSFEIHSKILFHILYFINKCIN